jgi:hypothetical protein
VGWWRPARPTREEEVDWVAWANCRSRERLELAAVKRRKDIFLSC